MLFFSLFGSCRALTGVVWLPVLRLFGSRSRAFRYPLDIVKTRLAASSKGDYRGIWHCLRHSVQAEGYRALFKGIGPALLAIMPASVRARAGSGESGVVAGRQVGGVAERRVGHAGGRAD